jgi:hypothetical protein
MGDWRVPALLNKRTTDGQNHIRGYDEGREKARRYLANLVSTLKGLNNAINDTPTQLVKYWISQ